MRLSALMPNFSVFSIMLCGSAHFLVYNVVSAFFSADLRIYYWLGPDGAIEGVASMRILLTSFVFGFGSPLLPLLPFLFRP